MSRRRYRYLELPGGVGAVLNRYDDEQERRSREAWRDRVEGAAESSRQAETFLHERIRQAHENGASLRQIAKWAGMSHEKVRSLIRSDQT